MLDFNNEEQQKEKSSGPIPAGSRVLVSMELQQPRFPYADNPLLAQTKGGLLQLFCKFTVLSGKYQDAFWFENITLPDAMQPYELSENQKLSARIGGTLIRAIIESARRVDPDDTSAAAQQKRRMNDWRELIGMKIPVKVGIDKKPYESQDGRQLWNNRILSVIPSTHREYKDLMNGSDFITDGPVTATPAKRRQPAQTGDYPAWSAANFVDRNMDSQQNWPESGDTVPF